ncbi:MAG TPA: glycosyltransferase [Bacteroidales bacterium]|nr:glycosyltransferase [Bacteroidales bacterium]
MGSPINIAILTPGFAAAEDDTSAIPSLQLYLKSLKAAFPEIRLHVLSFRYPFRKGDYDWNGIPVYAAGGKHRKWNHLGVWTRVFMRLYRMYRRGQLDLIHSFWLTETTLVGAMFGRLTGIPVLATAMGQDVKDQNRYLFFLRPFPLDVVLVSRFQSGVLKKRGKMNIGRVIPFGVDASCYHPDPSSERAVDILGAGSLNAVKNYDLFIRVVKQVSNEFPDLRCRILGGGPEKDRITQLIRENGLESNITLTGPLEYREVQEEMAGAKILLHTSRFEGQGLVITEALAAGMFVVCFPVGIAADPISEKIHTGSTGEELALKILEILRLKDPSFNPEIPLKIGQTVEEYASIYRTFV